ncbi:MAG: flippase [bacterium]|nr:flippase [bacterium]
MVKPEPTTEVSAGQSKILRNASYLTGAFVVQKLISFLYYTVIANKIGVSRTGQYDPLKSLIPIALILIDFSLSAVITREVARRPQSAKSILANVLGIKLLFAVIVLTVFGFVTNFGNFSQDVQSSLYLVAIIVAFDSFTLTFLAVLRGLQNMKLEAIGMILNQVIAVSAGYVALRYNLGLRGIFFATMLGSAVNFSWSIFALRRIAQLWPKLMWDAKLIVSFLKMALPFAIAAMLVKVYTYTDRYLLLLFKGPSAVGFYSVAHKLTFALEFLPSAFAAGLYPAMSNLYLSSKEKLTDTFERSLVYMIIISVPMSLGIFVLANSLVGLAFNEFFAAAANPLRILILSLPVIFMNFPVGTLLNASNRTKYNTISMGITVLVNISLNALLINRFSYMGAALATLVSGTVLFGMGLYWIRDVITVPWQRLVSRFLRVYAAAAVAALIIFPFRNTVPIFFHGRRADVLGWILVFVTIYVVGLILIKGVKREELTALWRIIRRKPASPHSSSRGGPTASHSSGTA